MGCSLMYQKEPLLDFQTEEGSSKSFKYAATSVTGWRNSQEDRLKCIVNYYDDYSFFAVYDGHGGHEIAEYLQKSFDNELINFLQIEPDVELALQTSFLSFDAHLRDISQDELMTVVDEEEFVLPDRKKFIQDLKDIYNPGVAGPSQEVLPPPALDDPLLCAIKSHTLKFLTMAELANEDSDDDDMDYVLDSENGENSESGESSMEDDDDNDDHKSDSEKDIEKNEKNICTGRSIHDEENEKDTIGDKHSDERKDKDSVDENVPEVAYEKGSTATVVLVSANCIYVANVGDSKCVACIKSKAFELSVDHKPTDELETERIIKCGSKVTDDGRIDGGLNMSRAFGDFSLKNKKASEMEQPVICDPHITSLHINQDLEFIIIASDGIWNSLTNQEIVDYVVIRLQDKDANLEDICEELCRSVIAPNTLGDGTGCDNISLIIILFHEKEYFVKNYQGNKDSINLDKIRVDESSNASNISTFSSATSEEKSCEENKGTCSAFPPQKTREHLAFEREEMCYSSLNVISNPVVKRSNYTVTGDMYSNVHSNPAYVYNYLNIKNNYGIGSEYASGSKNLQKYNNFDMSNYPNLSKFINSDIMQHHHLNKYLENCVLKHLSVIPDHRSLYRLFCNNIAIFSSFPSVHAGNRMMSIKCCDYIWQNDTFLSPTNCLCEGCYQNVMYEKAVNKSLALQAQQPSVDPHQNLLSSVSCVSYLEQANQNLIKKQPCDKIAVVVCADPNDEQTSVEKEKYKNESKVHELQTLVKYMISPITKLNIQNKAQLFITPVISWCKYSFKSQSTSANIEDAVNSMEQFISSEDGHSNKAIQKAIELCNIDYCFFKAILKTVIVDDYHIETIQKVQDTVLTLLLKIFRTKESIFC